MALGQKLALFYPYKRAGVGKTQQLESEYSEVINVYLPYVNRC